MKVCVVLCLLFVGACSKRSTATATVNKISDYYADFGILNSSSDSTLAECRLVFSSNSQEASTVAMESGDSAECGVNGTFTAMPQMSTGSFYLDGVTLSTTATYVIRFTRTRGDGVGVYEATLQMPAAPAVTSPTSGATISRASNLDVIWTPASSSGISVGVSGTGFGVGTTGSDTTGTGTIAAASMAQIPNGAGFLYVYRYLESTLPTGFGGGIVQSRRETRLSITFTD